jgi:hypothetical protein
MHLFSVTSQGEPHYHVDEWKDDKTLESAGEDVMKKRIWKKKQR